MQLLKIVASLIGVTLTLAGFGAFLWSLWELFAWLTYSPSGQHAAGASPATPPQPGVAIVLFLGAAVAIFVGTQLGRFARGDFD